MFAPIQDPYRVSSIVNWNPHTNNTLARVGKEFGYYKINIEKAKQVYDEFSDNQEDLFGLLTKQELQFESKCVSWSPAYSNVIAIGTGLGRVMLYDVKKQSVLKEFNPRYARSCNSLSWNQIHTNYIAAGLDKVRSDHSVIIWDINEVGKANSTNPIKNDFWSHIDSLALPKLRSDESVFKPLYEIGYGEAVTAVTWHPEQSLTVLVGTQSKLLKIYDLKDNPLKPKVISMHSKSINGVVFNPLDSRILATYSHEEPQVKIWDYRNLSEPINTLPIDPQKTLNQFVAQISWSPCNKNILGVLARDGSCLRIYDISEDRFNRHTGFKYSNFKAIYPDNYSIQSFSFHPKIPRTVAVSTEDSVKCIIIRESPRCCFSPHGNICYTTRNSMNEVDTMLTNDVSMKMKLRAQKAIGMNMIKNIQITKSLNDETKTVWIWLGKMKYLNELNGKTKRIHFDFSGVYSILGLDHPVTSTSSASTNVSGNTASSSSSNSSNSSISGSHQNLASSSSKKSSLVNSEQPPPPLPAQRKASINSSVQDGVETKSSHELGFTIYTSPQRHTILQICGWDGEQSKSFFEHERSERSAAIAIFNLDIKLAIKILTELQQQNSNGENGNNSKHNYRFIAFSLAGYSKERMHEYREVYNDLFPLIDDPYLRAAMAFLRGTDTNFNYILEEDKLQLIDRIAFACLYLKNDELKAYVTEMKKKTTKNGDLQGILMTGLSPDGVDLMQKYVDRTSDVQTACLLLRNVSPKRFKDERVDAWLESYRELLDQWQMWEERALLDTILTRFSSQSYEERTPEVIVKCTFCNQSLVHGSAMQTGRGTLGMTSRYGSNIVNRPRSTSCPNPTCKKPLPKCSICLMHYGTPAESMGEEKGKVDDKDASTVLDYCFAWCMTCKHGGHVKHLSQWFAKHSVCPVSNCNCNCSLSSM